LLGTKYNKKVVIKKRQITNNKLSFELSLDNWINLNLLKRKIKPIEAAKNIKL